MDELRRRGIPYTVVPGVTAAFAAAAALGIEFTLPEISQTLILTRMAGRTPVPEAEHLAALAGHRASMAIYLSVDQAEKMAAVLEHAYGPDAPCAVVYRASQPEQKIIRTRIGELARSVRAEKITRQAVVVVGRVLDSEGEETRSKLYDKDFTHGYRR
jgi:precorrin-4/cobalt-precorrin-4 C11-methyltransferase